MLAVHQMVFRFTKTPYPKGVTQIMTEQDTCDQLMHTPTHMHYIVFINLTQIRIVLEEGTSIEKLHPQDCPEGLFLGHFFLLMIDVRGLSPEWKVPCLVGISVLCKKAGVARHEEQGRKMLTLVSALICSHIFLQWWTVACKLKLTFSPASSFWFSIHHSEDEVSRTHMPHKVPQGKQTYSVISFQHTNKYRSHIPLWVLPKPT